LRQELREIEILNEITRLRFNNVLPKTVTGLYRRTLIRSYQAWKGVNYEIHGLHPSLEWQPDMGPRFVESFEYGSWNATATTRPPEACVTKASEMLKRAADTELSVSNKRQKTSSLLPVVSRIPRGGMPVGLIWDNIDFSCAYDATLGILCNIWLDNIA
ncbi:hypothetical protein B0H11DRAFT_1692824, partial [Mycena galericulata]